MADLPTAVDPGQRVRTQRHVEVMLALDNFQAVADRIRNLVSSGRRIAMTQRYTGSPHPPELYVGLTLDRRARGDGIVEGGDDTGRHLMVYLTSLRGFGLSAYAHDGNTTEAEARERYRKGADSDDHWARRRNLTVITINGGLGGDSPARDDSITIEHWNEHGVCDERVIGFDYGPAGARDRLARQLYLADGGPADVWDSFGYEPHAGRDEYYTRADELLAVIADERR